MFRFTIRDVLWLTVVVALGLAWCVDHFRQGKDLVRAKDEIGRAKEISSDLRSTLDSLMSQISAEGIDVEVDTKHYRKHLRGALPVPLKKPNHAPSNFAFTLMCCN
jgi:hypothetical protein